MSFTKIVLLWWSKTFSEEKVVGSIKNAEKIGKLCARKILSNLKKKYDYFLSKNPEFKKLDNLGIGASPSSKFEKFQHYEPMLSLSNSFSLGDTYDFFDKAKNFLKSKRQVF